MRAWVDLDPVGLDPGGAHLKDRVWNLPGIVSQMPWMSSSLFLAETFHGDISHARVLQHSCPMCWSAIGLRGNVAFWMMSELSCLRLLMWGNRLQCGMERQTLVPPLTARTLFSYCTIAILPDSILHFCFLQNQQFIVFWKNHVIIMATSSWFQLFMRGSHLAICKS